MGTFSATFLGHQGWLLRSTRTTWLVDPLLCEGFGDIHALCYAVYPPRILDLSLLPEVDAVFLTHEHDDHFDIPSLAKIDRKIPIFLSSHSSSAAFRILNAMGFRVERLTPGVVVEQGDLELVPFVGDHVGTSLGDEWDALPISVRETGGAGGFFSMVDVTLTARHVAWARAHVASPGLVTWSNNTLDFGHMASFATGGETATERSLAALRESAEMIRRGWGSPAATIVCAGGFAFTGERAWLNERVFRVDVARICHEVAEGRPGVVTAAIPGQTFVMEGGRLHHVVDSSEFLRARPREEWPSRAWQPIRELPDYAPATGQKAFGDERTGEMATRLDALAATLVGGVTFRSLRSLLSGEAKGRRVTFAFALRREGSAAPLVFEYDSSSCGFRQVLTTEPDARYLAGLSCWATDLLAILRGELGPIAIQFGRATLWNALPARFRFEIFEDLYRESHPLRRPDPFLRRYESVWANVPATAPLVRAR